MPIKLVSPFCLLAWQRREIWVKTTCKSLMPSIRIWLRNIISFLCRFYLKVWRQTQHLIKLISFTRTGKAGASLAALEALLDLGLRDFEDEVMAARGSGVKEEGRLA